MRLFIQTRGRTIDYEFLGGDPGRRWWTEYRDHTIFEEPTILVRSTDVGWDAYLGGIPSARKDLAGRTIRFTLVIANGQPADAEQAFPLVSGWLAGATGAGSRLPDALDGAFDEAVVEQALAAPDPGDERDGELARRLADVLARVGAGRESPGPFDTAGGTWLGSARDPQAQSGFLAHAAAIMSGRARGRALLLNVVRGRAAARALVEAGEAGAGSVILAANPREDIEGLVRLPEPPPPPPPPPPDGGWPAWAPAAAILLGLVIAAWVGYEVWQELWRRLHH